MILSQTGPWGALHRRPPRCSGAISVSHWACLASATSVVCSAGQPPDSATSRASEAQRPGPLPAPPGTPCSGLLSLPPGSRLCEGIGRAKRLNRTVSGWGGAHSPQLGKGTSSPSQGRTAVLSGELRSASQRGCARPSAPPSVCKTESTRDTLATSQLHPAALARVQCRRGSKAGSPPGLLLAGPPGDPPWDRAEQRGFLSRWFLLSAFTAEPAGLPASQLEGRAPPMRLRWSEGG